MTITDRDPGDENQPAAPTAQAEMHPTLYELVECMSEAIGLLATFDYSGAWAAKIARYREAIFATGAFVRPASAPRYEHEWRDHSGGRRRVAWSGHGGKAWERQRYSPDLGIWVDSSDEPREVLAEFARLAGLTRPEEPAR